MTRNLLPRQSLTESSLVARLGSLADGTRLRMLVVLELHELSVGELCSVLQLPQSTVSRHLKILVEHAWLGARRDGTSHFYRLELETLEPQGQSLWEATRPSAASLAESSGDQLRVEAVLAARRGASRAFFAASAAGWDPLRDQLFGPVFESTALLGLLDPRLEVADLACGTGRVAEVLAPFVSRIYAIDESTRMLEAARARLERLEQWPNIDLREGTLEALPLESAWVDVATLVLALHHLAEPSLALAEARRILRAGGRVLVVDLMPHEREELRRELGHVWLGFDRERLERFCDAAGLTLDSYHPLPVSADATGPALFCALASAPIDPSAATRERVLFPRSTSR